MSKIDDFDIDSLTLVLNNELDFVVAALQQDEAMSNLRIEKVKVKMGQRQQDAVPFFNGLDENRYPTEEPWEVELDYNINQPNSRNQVVNITSIQKDSYLLENVKDLSIQKVKGIDTYWKKAWAKINVKTIGQLASLSHEKVLELSKKENSILPIEQHSKSLLMQDVMIHNLLDGFESIPLDTFLLNDLVALKTIFNNKISTVQLGNFQRQARLLLIVLDADYFKKLTVSVLN